MRRCRRPAGRSRSIGEGSAASSRRGSPLPGWPGITWRSTTACSSTRRPRRDRAGPGFDGKRALMEEVIRVQEQYYVLAESARADERTQVLKHGETFAICDRYGNMLPIGLGEQGVFHEGTRHLSRLELKISGRRPLLLSSTVREGNELLAVDLTNPDLSSGGAVVPPRRTPTPARH